MPYIVYVFGPRFKRMSFAETPFDAERIRKYWRKRGMSTHTEEIVTR